MGVGELAFGHLIICVLLAGIALFPLGAQGVKRKDFLSDTAKTSRSDTVPEHEAPPDRIKPPEPPAPKVRTPGWQSPIDSTAISKLLRTKSDLDVGFFGRFEFRGEKSESNRCRGFQFFVSSTGCRSKFEPMLDFQYAIQSKGIVASRMAVDVDYDSQREYDASNTLSLQYKGAGREFLRELELGNITFNPPRSYFLSGAIPLGNYGLQAVANLGAGATLRAIIAQQKGNVVRDRQFTMGGQAYQTIDRIIEDYQFEQRRFFFTVDPRLFSGYPNIDILNSAQLASLASSLPDTLRPVRLYVYRLLIGGQPLNPNGPQFRVLGDPNSKRGQVYEYLREGIDYHADRSLLWISLVRPLSLNNERLVLAYKVRINGVETTHITTGGTPDLEFNRSGEQYAQLLWDPKVQPTDAAFRREIRSVYRVGGSEIVRSTVKVQILTGSAGDQEKPISGTEATYLERFGLAQLSDRERFDINNRIWPTKSAHNVALGAGSLHQEIIRDRFIVFPSLQPFGRNGLAGSSNPNNDTLYKIPSEYLYSSQRPVPVYKLRLQYESEGSGEDGVLMLGAVQLRPYSERIRIDQVSLVRGVDYQIDYDLGRVRFSRPDTLFVHSRPITVQFEEIPLFVETPTTIFGGILDVPLSSGRLSFMALSQSEKSPYTRPLLGFEPQSIWFGSVNASMGFDADKISNLLKRLPYQTTNTKSQINVDAEFAVSRPNNKKGMQAYVESFEGDGGISVRLDDQYWYYGSQPANGTVAPTRIGAASLDINRATALAWQTNVTDRFGRQIRYSIEQIDPKSTLVGAGVAAPEQILWFTMFPTDIGGYGKRGGPYAWLTNSAVNGRRWRSITSPLGLGGGTGVDLTRSEYIEFWALVNTSDIDRAQNPTLLIDVGDISENSVVFAPDTVYLRRNSEGGIDTLMRGRKLAGYNVMNTERDRFSRTFDVSVNDRGLPGDVADSVTLVVDTIIGQPPMLLNNQRVIVCNNGQRVLYPLGDNRSNCTVGNGKLDEEDLDSDNVLNLTDAERDQEKWRRYIVDLANEANFLRKGNCAARSVLASSEVVPPGVSDSVCWVNVKIPFRSPDDTLNNPLLRKAQAVRLTVVSGAATPDSAISQFAIARLRFTGAPWIKRDDAALRGIGGEGASGGFMIAGTIGTQDKDVRNGIDYVSPPGISDIADSKIPIGSSRIQVNERSLRITAGGLNQFERAEAYYRFPDGQKSFMGYKELRLWARGIGNGWGVDGDLQFYVKIGRDASNFYLYRTPLNNGVGQSAWLPEIRLNFERFIRLRSQIQNAYLNGTTANTCTGLDSALIANSLLPLGSSASLRYAACDDGYMVYSIDPSINAPNLAAVQELSVGILRKSIGSGTSPISPSDTLELWVDDVRLAGPVNAAGFAAHVGFGVVAGDFAEFRTNLIRKDPHFRQLGEHPSYLTNDGVELSAAFHLEKLFSRSLGYSIPFTVSYTNRTIAPMYISGSDLEADAISNLRTPKNAATAFSLGVRRIDPIKNSPLGLLVNNLSAFSSYTSLADRSEYSDNRGYNFRGGLAYNLTSDALPSAISKIPAELNVHTGYEAGADTRTTHSTLIVSDATPNGRAQSIDRLIRSGSSLTVRPFSNAYLNMQLQSVRDLRSYDNILGLSSLNDIGSERARNFTTELTVTPYLSRWIQSRITTTSGFNLNRDVNAWPLISPDQNPSGKLPVQIGNEHLTLLGLTVEPAAFARGSTTLPNWGRSLLNMLQPLDIQMDRSLLTSFDAAPRNPTLMYQLGLGGLRDFLTSKGTLATSAGVSTQVVATQGVILPFGLSISTRFQHLTLRNWMKHLQGRLDVADATQTTFPDISLRWNARPSSDESPLKQINASIRWAGTKQLLKSPGEYSPASGNDGRVNINSFPFSLSTTWGSAHPLTTSLGATYSERRDRRPGASGRGNLLDLSAEIARAFPLPSSWQPRSDLRTRLAYYNSNGRSFVINPLSSILESRLMDNGRRSVTLTADTDVAENMSSSFVISRVASFDRNLNRKFTQTVLSAVLNIQFFAGDKK